MKKNKNKKTTKNPDFPSIFCFVEKIGLALAKTRKKEQKILALYRKSNKKIVVTKLLYNYCREMTELLMTHLEMMMMLTDWLPLPNLLRTNM